MVSPEIKVSGAGIVKAPELTDDDLDAIRRRADAVEDPQLRTDLFRLLRELERRPVCED